MNVLIGLLLVVFACLALTWAIMSLGRARMSPLAESRGRFFTIKMSSSRPLDLNLPGNLDHFFGFEIEPVDQFDRVAIEKRE
jgi:hypothetical protein